jgi:hypothetical protein
MSMNIEEVGIHAKKKECESYLTKRTERAWYL